MESGSAEEAGSIDIGSGSGDDVPWFPPQPPSPCLQAHSISPLPPHDHCLAVHPSLTLPRPPNLSSAAHPSLPLPRPPTLTPRGSVEPTSYGNTILPSFTTSLPEMPNRGLPEAALVTICAFVPFALIFCILVALCRVGWPSRYDLRKLTSRSSKHPAPRARGAHGHWDAGRKNVATDPGRPGRTCQWL
eukprot:CAMPEP_0119315716 /NCGR_PEP_ID=MMETSP1333-20130426/36896_1 /TAXON_ID=418940 /ORGANISM="Scyphosphaera apsteinii, Strain RCC1455" /LENGTH=188 /DNA_ID=CAMNT_0007321161 /DNA_START=53 /DNA_END=619 /DNA_ORIENTATION=+